MKNQDMPIVPTILRKIGEDEFRIASDKDLREGIYLSSQLGLTKREYFAGLAMQGLLTIFSDREQSPIVPNIENVEYMAKLSAKAADALLNELNKT